MIALDNTTISDFRKCMRMGYYRHVRGWTYEKPSPALVFGAAWHDALDVVWTTLCKSVLPSVPGTENDPFKAFLASWKAAGGPWPIPGAAQKFWHPRTPETARLMLEAYQQKRMKTLANMTLLQAEQPFAVPLLPGVYYTGRRDKMVDTGKGVVIVEHKTTSMGSASGFRETWVGSWSPSSQIDGYIYSAGLAYPNLQGVWVDGALVHATAHNVFEFIPIRRHPHHIDAWLWGARYWAGLIKQHWTAVRPEAVNEVQRTDATEQAAPGKRTTGSERPLQKDTFLAAFPQNTEACIQYNKLCPYINVCKMHPNPEQLDKPPVGMVERFWHPFDKKELEEIASTSIAKGPTA